MRARSRVRHLRPMLSAVLIATGLFATAWGCWRGYAAARAVHARTRVRVAVRNVVFAVAWLAVAMYGLYLATVGMEARA